MKAKEWEQLKNSTEAELRAKIGTLRRRRSELEFANKATKVKNPLEIRSVRRMMARINTLLRASSAGKTSAAAGSENIKRGKN